MGLPHYWPGWRSGLGASSQAVLSELGPTIPPLESVRGRGSGIGARHSWPLSVGRGARALGPRLDFSRSRSTRPDDKSGLDRQRARPPWTAGSARTEPAGRADARLGPDAGLGPLDHGGNLDGDACLVEEDADRARAEREAQGRFDLIR